MIKIKFIVSLLLLVFAQQCLSQIDHGSLINREPNKCYGRCDQASIFESYEVSYSIYLGNNFSNSNLDTLIINEYEKDLPKKRWKQIEETNGNFIWCLLDHKYEPEYIVIVKDTTITDEFYTEYFVIEKLLKQGGKKMWTEIICKDKISDRLITNIQNELQFLDIYKGQINGRLDKETYKALSSFQREKNIRIGEVTYETLDLLGINY